MINGQICGTTRFDTLSLDLVLFRTLRGPIALFMIYMVLSYASPLIWKLHPHGDVTSKTYKPVFHGGHLSHNTSYSSATTLWVFCLLQQGYSYSTRSSMTELPLSVSQH